ncbi:hypothetical protein ON010_g10316 [Phytophthora cinnamomi]|nr:hypothetical protein ON010_g10316 [Phytophthora cinnamomi]
MYLFDLGGGCNAAGTLKWAVALASGGFHCSFSSAAWALRAFIPEFARLPPSRSPESPPSTQRNRYQDADPCHPRSDCLAGTDPVEHCHGAVEHECGR